jgi:hypothetical protein
MGLLPPSPLGVSSGAKVAELRHTQSGPDPARHPVLDVGYPRSPFHARTSSNSFAHRLGTGNSALRLAPGPVGLKPELRDGRSEFIYNIEVHGCLVSSHESTQLLRGGIFTFRMFCGCDLCTAKPWWKAFSE